MSTAVTVAPAIDQDGMPIDPDAWDVHVEIVALRNHAVETFLQLGAALSKFTEMQGWRVLQHPSFKSYIADPDVDISRSLAYRLIGVHEMFVELLECPPDGLLAAGPNKLELLIPHMHSQNVDEWVNKAAALSRSRLREELREEFGDDAPPPLPTDYRARYIWCRRILRQKYWKHNQRER